MRIHAKGLHWTVGKLADGTTKTYWYAGRGGPRLEGEPGSPEFIASHNRGAGTKTEAPQRGGGHKDSSARGAASGADASLPAESGLSRSKGAHASRLRQTDREDRAEAWRLPAEGAGRSAHARCLPRLA